MIKTSPNEAPAPEPTAVPTAGADEPTTAPVDTAMARIPLAKASLSLSVAPKPKPLIFFFDNLYFSLPKKPNFFAGFCEPNLIAFTNFEASPPAFFHKAS